MWQPSSQVGSFPLVAPPLPNRPLPFAFCQLRKQLPHLFSPLSSSPSLSLCMCSPSVVVCGCRLCAPESRPPFGFAHFCEEVTFFALRFTINYFIGELLSVYISSAPARCLELPCNPPPPQHTHTPGPVPCQKPIQLSIVYSCALPICLSLCVCRGASPFSLPCLVCFLHISVNFICQRDAYVMCKPKKKNKTKIGQKKATIK